MPNEEKQHAPVRIYRTDNQIGLAAPLPGLEPEDITVKIEGRRVEIHGKERGPHQHDRDMVKAEWTIGPYHSAVDLPEEVDGRLANATYGNGVLVLLMPTAERGKANPAEFSLESIRTARGERIGHTGHEIRPTSTREHSARLAERSKKPAA